jgi:MFS family permease
MEWQASTPSERPISHRNVWAILAAMVLLGTAYGISSAVVSLHLRRLGFDTAEIGWMATAFAIGIAIGSLPSGQLVRKLSPKGAMLFGLVGYAGCNLLFARCSNGTAIALLRALDGACSVVVWVAAETELLRRTSKSHKAYVMSLYAIALAVGYVVGPLLARTLLSVLAMQHIFVCAGALAGLAILVLSYWMQNTDTLRTVETIHGNVRVSSALILREIRCAAFATFAYGYFQISVVALLPIFLIQDRSISEAQTILLTALFALGMLIFSNIAGRIGDRLGHLRTMRALACVGLAMVASFAMLTAFSWMCVAVCVAGASLASLSPLSLALVGKRVAAAELHRASALYNGFYAAGMILGPSISGFIFRSCGGAAMLLHLSAVWLAFVGFTWQCRNDDRAVATGDFSPAQ